MNWLAVASRGLLTDQAASDIYIHNRVWDAYIVTAGLWAGTDVYFYPQDDSEYGLDMGTEMGL